MNLVSYNNRCRCNEEFSFIKKRKLIIRNEGKPFQYPKSNDILSKTFKIKYEKSLSLTAKLILNNFHNKYIYYAMDDILYGFKFNLNERDDLLALLYSPIISLQNNLSINFLNIWIHEIYINELSNKNKFLNKNLNFSKEFSLITIKFFYKTKLPLKKYEPLW